MLAALLLLLGTSLAADWPDLSKPPRGGADGRKDVALVVGIEDYAFAPDVPGAQANARDWYSWLQDSRGVQTIKILLDRDATREGIIDAAKAVAARAQAGGTVWVVFVGHGAPASSADDGLLVGVDAQQKATSLDARSVRRAELLELLDGPQAQTVVVLDACFSGRTAAGSLVPGLQPLKPVSARTDTKATVLTAAASDQYAGALAGADRPAFSYLVLGALWGWGDADRDGSVTADEAVRYASDALFRTVNDRAQTPSLDARDEGLVLSRASSTRGPDLGAIALTQTTPATTAAQTTAAQTAPVQTAPTTASPPVTVAPVDNSAGLDRAEAALRQQATADWQALQGMINDGNLQVEDLIRRFLSRYQEASVSVGGQSRPVLVQEVALAHQTLAWIAQATAVPPEVESYDTGGYDPGTFVPATCLEQGEAVLMEIARQVNLGVPASVVAQQMVAAQTCYSEADILWLQLNGAPWEVQQQAQQLWTGW